MKSVVLDESQRYQCVMAVCVCVCLERNAEVQVYLSTQYAPSILMQISQLYLLRGLEAVTSQQQRTYPPQKSWFLHPILQSEELGILKKSV